ncbi:PadR family transcriptional regulator [Dactylosporangium sucinum]|uniref:Transcription regulator PadR N-terminal domain-containing protein n=1 Tax=Dactylosporangium sucinum TaxID=1424081 RepID=A0A917WUB4_9ACTN|nr:PadR family transcriptional regulator [Dactylosporangium sucinum]GGM33005.1 hypothetical protein GCM10007977_037960 [Dactylosporangium sucinum]
MTAVFSHGRLRLYLLKLLAEGPKHGYELIRLLEHRFHGLYAPSAGTIYPRLARMEADGLIGHSAAGGRKTYEITDAGRAELVARFGELAELEQEIRESVADLTALANHVEQGVRGSIRDLKRELRQARKEARQGYPRAAAGEIEAARPQEPPAVLEFDDRLDEFVAEARRMARAEGVSPEALRAATVVVETAVEQVRRLLG